MVHICPRCGYSNAHKNNMRKHYKRKKICDDKNLSGLSLTQCKSMLEENKLKDNQKPDPVYTEIMKISSNLEILNKNFSEMQKVLDSQKKMIQKQQQIINFLKQNQKEILKPINKQCVFILLEQQNIENCITKLGMGTDFNKIRLDIPKDTKILEIKRCENARSKLNDLSGIFNIMFKLRADLGDCYYEGNANTMCDVFNDYFKS